MARPSPSGSIQSSTMRSNVCFDPTSTPAATVPQTVGSMPSSESARFRKSAREGSSSTTSTRMSHPSPYGLIRRELVRCYAIDSLRDLSNVTSKRQKDCRMLDGGFGVGHLALQIDGLGARLPHRLIGIEELGDSHRAGLI